MKLIALEKPSTIKSKAPVNMPKIVSPKPVINEAIEPIASLAGCKKYSSTASPAALNASPAASPILSSKSPTSSKNSPIG